MRIKRSSGLVGLCIMVICLVMFMNRKTYAEQGDYMLKVNVASGCITVYEKEVTENIMWQLRHLAVRQMIQL